MPVPSAAPADADGVHRILPKTVWDGHVGEALAQADFSPDDPANLAMTPDRARAVEDAATARMNALVSKVNAHIPNVRVVPWAMIPWAVWQGSNAEFLIKQDYAPSSPWNTMLLSADAASAEFLGLPEHPREPIAGLDQHLGGLITELRLKSRDHATRRLAAFTRGDHSALDDAEALKTENFQKIFALARYVASDVFGAAVCARHDELFGIGLSEVTD